MRFAQVSERFSGLTRVRLLVAASGPLSYTQYTLVYALARWVARRAAVENSSRHMFTLYTWVEVCFGECLRGGLALR